jgi:cell division protein FtsI/penicillin-binding protein 2
MHSVHRAKLLISCLPGCFCALSLIITSLFITACTPGYRPQIPARPAVSETDLSDMAYEALGQRAGVMILVDPRYGRVVKRVSRGTDVQFAAAPFELAQLVTAYAALEAGAITDRTTSECRETKRQIEVTEALAHSCPAFFAELSRRITHAQFVRAAGVIGFIYYGIESPTYDQTLIRPVTARIAAHSSAQAFTELAVKGAGMEARDLHFAQLAASLASGTTASERFAAYIMVSAKAAAPPVVSLNQQALAVIRRGLIRAVDEGEAKAAAQVGRKVAGKVGSGNGDALFISYAPADEPEIAVVVYLKEAVGRDAAEVAGKFYQYWFRK